jgi:hypothetical protein
MVPTIISMQEQALQFVDGGFMGSWKGEWQGPLNMQVFCEFLQGTAKEEGSEVL